MADTRKVLMRSEHYLKFVYEPLYANLHVNVFQLHLVEKKLHKKAIEHPPSKENVSDLSHHKV